MVGKVVSPAVSAAPLLVLLGAGVMLFDLRIRGSSVLGLFAVAAARFPFEQAKVYWG
ncbi:MAG: hypothetical protein ACRDU8_04795 [Egibacteraceae bacterium]